jgi:hypothetical protein
MEGSVVGTGPVTSLTAGVVVVGFDGSVVVVGVVTGFGVVVGVGVGVAVAIGGLGALI